MLVNDSYNHKEVNRKIIESVGKSYGLLERFKRKGIGSPRLLIAEASSEIDELLRLDSNMNWCYIELRPKGLVLRFRSLLETYALVIPFWKLVLYKTDAGLYTIYKDQYFVRIQVKSKQAHDFIKRLQGLKAAQHEHSMPV